MKHKIRFTKKTDPETKIKPKSGIGAVIGIGMLIAMTAISTASYNSWFADYINDKNIETEKQKLSIPIIENVIGDNLYLKNTFEEDLTINKVTIGGQDCDESLSLEKGITNVNIESCLSGLEKGKHEIVVYTNLGLHAEYFYLNPKPSEPGTFLGEDLIIGDGVGKYENGSFIDSACYELQSIANNLDGDYIIIKDINCSSSRDWNDGVGFIPIGNWTTPFTGTLEGNTNEVFDLYIGSGRKNTGFFAYMKGAEITNLNLNVDEVFSEGKILGGLSGEIEDSYIENVHIFGSVIGDRKEIGGIAGTTVNTTIIRSSFTGEVVGNRKSVGGFIGVAIDTVIENSYATGNITGDRDYTGGLVGELIDSQVVNSYAIMEIFTTGNAGGLIGNSDNSIVNDSYWDLEVSNLGISAGGEFKTSFDMKLQTTFSNWDFGTIWNINDGVSNPVLR